MLLFPFNWWLLTWNSLFVFMQIDRNEWITKTNNKKALKVQTCWERSRAFKSLRTRQSRFLLDALPFFCLFVRYLVSRHVSVKNWNTNWIEKSFSTAFELTGKNQLKFVLKTFKRVEKIFRKSKSDYKDRNYKLDKLEHLRVSHKF